ncbi:PD-(D/E)XK nuclease family protein [Candidatus Sumerlaeota bacterium]|nr:PD-(D/E)XK nuclease family protein [Candidatus Sumerlaeota bacterium]
MAAIAIQEKEERLIHSGAPKLSYSRINRYQLCPEQYRLYYEEKLRLKIPPANLVFGQFIHQALANLFLHGADPAKHFIELWEQIQDAELKYSGRDSWDSLKTKGEKLMSKFIDEELTHIEKVEAVEQPFELIITNLEASLIGVIDLVATVDGKRTVIDFKTSASAYAESDVVLSDQLTAYRLAQPEAENLALCVLVKTKQPSIEWHWTQRDGQQLTEFLEKAAYIGQQITERQFHKRPGMWCKWCDYLPVCLRNQQEVERLFVQG